MFFNYPRTTASIGTGLLFVAYQCRREFERMQDRATSESDAAIKHAAAKSECAAKVNSICEEYNQTVRPIAKKSHKICKDWTNTSCQSASEILPFLEKYVKIKALQEGQKMTVPSPSRKDLRDYDVLEQHRRKEMDFWCNKVYKESLPLDMLTYPGLNEAKVFSTFHWALYMAVNRCAYEPGQEGKQPPIYTWIVDQSIGGESFDVADSEHIKKYRATVMDEFPLIQERTFGKK